MRNFVQRERERENLFLKTILPRGRRVGVQRIAASRETSARSKGREGRGGQDERQGVYKITKIASTGGEEKANPRVDGGSCVIRKEGRGHGGFIQRCVVGRVLSGLSRQPSLYGSLTLSLFHLPLSHLPRPARWYRSPYPILPYPNSRRTYVLTVSNAPVDGHRGSTERTTVDDDEDYRPFFFHSHNQFYTRELRQYNYDVNSWCTVSRARDTCVDMTLAQRSHRPPGG